MDHNNEIISLRKTIHKRNETIPNRYPLARNLEKIMEEAGERRFIFEIEKDETPGLWSISFAAAYRQRLFSDIAGVIALHNINILSAELFIWKEENIAEISMKTRILKATPPDPLWIKVQRDLQFIDCGKLALPYRLHIKLFPPKNNRSRNASDHSEVVVDNEASELFTQIRIITRDRVGLLYRIVNVLDELRLITRSAEITTAGERVEDLFYVHDLNGDKVKERSQIREIKRALLHQASLT